ncbi:hypothetical protein [Leifsonia sp. 2MCAF36]|uniref:hypothetical protein n=1 Tax=Leifsonia sp. 2MCAF36 TaxID=3232988 RepID=UPI003F9BA8E8
MWAGRRYRAVTAEALRTAVAHDALTHPAEHLVGWSVTGRSEQDPADLRVFQLQRHDVGWILVDVELA